MKGGRIGVRVLMGVILLWTVVPLAWMVLSRPRSSTRRILPEIVFGRSANSMRRRRLYGARCSRA